MNGQPDVFSRRRRFAVLVVCLVLAVISVLFLNARIRETTLRRMGHWLDVGVEPTKASAIMVLNGDESTRPLRAAQLYHQGIAPKVIFARVQTQIDPSSTMLSAHEQVRAMLVRCGVPDEAIHILDRDCISTSDEARAAGGWLESHPGSTLITVTNNYHSRRSRWIFRRWAPIDRIQFVSAPTDEYGPDSWWLHQGGFTLYGAEFLKFGLYVFLYGYGWVAVILLFSVGWRYFRKAA